MILSLIIKYLSNIIIKHYQTLNNLIIKYQTSSMVRQISTHQTTNIKKYQIQWWDKYQHIKQQISKNIKSYQILSMVRQQCNNMQQLSMVIMVGSWERIAIAIPYHVACWILSYGDSMWQQWRSSSSSSAMLSPAAAADNLCPACSLALRCSRQGHDKVLFEDFRFEDLIQNDLKFKMWAWNNPWT